MINIIRRHLNFQCIKYNYCVNLCKMEMKYYDKIYIHICVCIFFHYNTLQ